MIRLRQTLLGILTLSLLASFQSKAEETHLVSSLGEMSPEYKAALEESNAARDAFYKKCEDPGISDALGAHSSPDCDFLVLLERNDKKLEAVYERYPNTGKVRVSRKNGPLVLVLAGLDRMKWRVRARRGVQIKRILLAGGPGQSVRLPRHLRNQNIEIQDISRTAYAIPMVDDRIKPVAGPSYDDNWTPTCPTEPDEFVVNSQQSSLALTIDALRDIGLELTSAQADRYDEAARNGPDFLIGDKTEGILLDRYLDTLMCYQNPDGSLVLGSALNS